MRMAKRVLGLIDLAESVAATAAYAIVAALLIGDVVGREVLGTGIFGAQKMAVYAAVVAGFLGLALATSANAHLRPTFLDHVLKGPRVDRLGDAAACLFQGHQRIVDQRTVAAAGIGAAAVGQRLQRQQGGVEGAPGFPLFD